MIFAIWQVKSGMALQNIYYLKRRVIFYLSKLPGEGIKLVMKRRKKNFYGMKQKKLVATQILNPAACQKKLNHVMLSTLIILIGNS